LIPNLSNLGRREKRFFVTEIATSFICDGASHAAREERVISFGLSEALLWLNENPAEEQTLRDRRFGPTSDISLK